MAINDNKLCKFRVSNFKCFNNDFELDLTNVNGYGFNVDCIQKGIVNNAIIYGQNGSGKSNLALAIFDIIEHLTDKEKNHGVYENYLCAYSDYEYATFYFEFLINSNKVVYEYKKTDYKTIIYERFTINDEEFIFSDRRVSSKAKINFAGTETLNNDVNNSELSILKYIKNNSELTDNESARAFKSFFDFVESMLFFRSLNFNMFLGFKKYSSETLTDIIINKDKVEDFERFLNEAGVDCKLKVVDSPLGAKMLAFDFDGKLIEFFKASSTGTNSLLLFYSWYITVLENGVSFLFIDEFDAFYHNELASMIVKRLHETGVQFILTSHNLSIMTNKLLRPDCYFSMNNRMISSFSNLTTKELREAHNIEKMYKAGTFYVE